MTSVEQFQNCSGRELKIIFLQPLVCHAEECSIIFRSNSMFYVYADRRTEHSTRLSSSLINFAHHKHNYYNIYRVRQKNLRVFKSRYIGNRVG